MTPWRLIIREILHRKLDFVLGALGVLIAVTALGAVTEVLSRHGRNTGTILKRVSDDTNERVISTRTEAFRLTQAKRTEADQRVQGERARVAHDVAAKRAKLARALKEERTEADLAVEMKRHAVAGEVSRREAEVAAEVARLDDEIRKIMKKMGFNIFILPKPPESGSLLPEDEKPAYMPEDYVTRLANSTIITVRHLLPLLECRVEWPEQGGRQFILVGMRGEVPLVNKTPKKPMAQPIKDGTIVLGYKLWTRLKLKAGQTVTLMGRKFTVAACYPDRGTKDDSRAWVPLAAAQEMLHAKGVIEKKNLISAIWALECKCAWRDLAKVREEIHKILPDTLIKEDGPKALARAEARQKVEEDGKARIERTKKDGQVQIDRVKAEGAARIKQVKERGLARIESTEREGKMTIMQTEKDGDEELKRVKDEGTEELDRVEKAGNAEFRRVTAYRTLRLKQLKRLSKVVLWSSIGGAGAWVGLMTYAGMRRRRREIGILRAIGVRAGQVGFVFLVRAVLLGLLGSAAGCGIGFAVGSWLGEALHADAPPGGFGVTDMLIVVPAAAILSALATVIPAAIAGQQDPAAVLQEE